MPAGLRPVAVPTARTAAGRPTARAIWLYDAVRPAGISRIACQTSRWNGVPERLTSIVSSAQTSPSK